MALDSAFKVGLFQAALWMCMPPLVHLYKFMSSSATTRDWIQNVPKFPKPPYHFLCRPWPSLSDHWLWVLPPQHILCRNFDRALHCAPWFFPGSQLNIQSWVTHQKTFCLIGESYFSVWPHKTVVHSSLFILVAFKQLSVFGLLRAKLLQDLQAGLG